MEEPRIIELPKFLDARGNLSFAQNNTHIPFEIKRTYWLYDVPGGESRGGHAYRETEEFVIALSGSFDVIVDDGKEKKTFHLMHLTTSTSLHSTLTQMIAQITILIQV